MTVADDDFRPDDSSTPDFCQPLPPPSGLKLLPEIMTATAQMLGVDMAILRSFRIPELGKGNLYEKTPSRLGWDRLKLTAYETHSLIFLSNIDENSPIYQGTGITATLIVPVLLNEELLAVFAFHHRSRPHVWTEGEIQLASVMAQQGVLIISQARAYTIAHSLAKREALINTITAAIRSSLDPAVIFQTITHQLGRALTVDGCALSLWTRSDDYVQCVGLYDRSQGNASLPLSLVPIARNPVLGQLIATRAPIILADLSRYPDLHRFDLPLRLSARALLIVPLLVEGEIIGSISLRQTHTVRHWKRAEIDLAVAVASQSAIAVQQARLYDTTKRQAEAIQQNEQKVKELNQYLLESVLKRFLPASIVNRVAAGELVLDLRPETRSITVLFSDIVGFTPLSIQLGQKRVATLLNEYLSAMTCAVFEQGGTVDKFMGDAIFALFGAPETLSLEEQAKKAIATARSMHYYLNQLNRQWQSAGIIGNHGIPPVQFRCGIHQGNAVVGMFGGGQRSDYTAVGLAVNIAARLQEAAKANTILVSHSVARYLSAREIIHSESLKFKGIEEEIVAYSVSIFTV